MNTPLILVVEEGRIGKERMTKLLKLTDVEVDTTDNAKTALELLRAKHYTLAVIDLTLPTLEGWKLLRSLRSSREFAHFPCIAIAPHTTNWAQQKMLQTGFTTFMPTQPLSALAQEIHQAAHKSRFFSAKT